MIFARIDKQGGPLFAMLMPERIGSIFVGEGRIVITDSDEPEVLMSLPLMTEADARVRGALMIKGYRIEDMGAEYGENFNGQYRWMNDKNDDFGVPQFSEDDAWADALQYAPKFDAYTAQQEN